MKIEDIIKVVCQEYKIPSNYRNPVKYLITRSNQSEYVEARQIVIYFLKKLFKLSNKKIAKIIYRDRCTVIHSLKRVNDLIEFDHKFRDKINLLEDFIIKMDLNINNYNDRKQIFAI